MNFFEISTSLLKCIIAAPRSMVIFASTEVCTPRAITSMHTHTRNLRPPQFIITSTYTHKSERRKRRAPASERRHLQKFAPRAGRAVCLGHSLPALIEKKDADTRGAAELQRDALPGLLLLLLWEGGKRRWWRRRARMCENASRRGNEIIHWRSRGCGPP